MANLTRRSSEPSLRRDIDRMFDEAFYYPMGFTQNWAYPAIDMYQDDQNVVVKAYVPDVNPDDLDVSITGRTLTLHGEFNKENKKEDRNYHIREMASGSFSRSITLPVMVDIDHAQASCENGVLTLTLPKTEDAKPKNIPVKQIKGK
ncbi:MAG: Hsp20/alpha crystallin family protein [Omnitrophica WOR_2 bacterium]